MIQHRSHTVGDFNADSSHHEVIGFIVHQLASEYPNPPIPIEAVEEKIAIWRASGMYNDLSDEDWERSAFTSRPR